MGKIRGWRKLSEVGDLIEWVNPRSSATVMVQRAEVPRPVWIVGIYIRGVFVNERFYKQKEDATKAATAYMRRHPFG